MNKKMIFALSVSVALFYPAYINAQSSAPVVAPGPQVLPAAQAAPPPPPAPAPVVAAAPAMASAPAVQSAPVMQNAPRVMSAPRIRNAQAVGKRPYIHKAPVLNGGGASNSLSQSVQSSDGWNNMIEINGDGSAVPQGTVQISLENDDDASAALPPARQAKTITDKAAQDKAVAGLKAWDKKLTSLKTGFEQSTTYDGTDVSKSTGALYFSKPNKLRLENLNAAGKTTQITLTDKKKIKVFDADMKPVKTYNWKDWFDSQPNKAFFDFGNYSALFENNEITNFEDNQDGTVTLTLEPTARDQKIFITLSTKDYFPTVVALAVDEMLTTTVLKDTEINGKLPDVFKGL
ncbi:MAG: outer-membrane lipoprotein carrier protein LolA [Elusimicrobia bacterium]|nr:outer-membrane lipoprotein carrier protein LolA [Elusimicrobiota bacterium]